MTNQFNFKCSDKQKTDIQRRAERFGFASVSAYVKFVSLNAIISVRSNDVKKETRQTKI